MPDDSTGVALAVDVGGTKVDAALVTHDGRLLAETTTRRPTGRTSSREQIAASITDAAASALAHLTADQHLVGIGIGAAGPVDLPRGAVSPLNLPNARALDVVGLLGRLAPDARVRLALDGTCIALAEHWLGVLAGCRTGLAMVVSTGIGGGFIANDQPVTGASGNAGHIGQIRIGPPDNADPFSGTVEAIGSGTAAVAWARAEGWPGASGEDLAAAYRAGDDIALRAVRRSADAVGRAIATAATLFDLEATAIAGGFVNVADDYIDLVRVAAQRSAVLPYAKEVRIERSSLGGDGPLLGAAALILRG